MLLKSLIKEYGKISFKEYKGRGKFSDKVYSYEKFIKKLEWIDFEEVQFEHDKYLKDKRVFNGKYGQYWVIITDKGLRFALTDGDYIQSTIKDDLFILMGHEGFDIYELKGYRKK